MKTLLTLLVGVAASAVIVGNAFAADLTMEPPAMDTMAATTDWTGIYAGLGVNASHYDGFFPENFVGVEGILGFNVAADQFLFGAEGYLAGVSGDSLVGQTWKAGGELRAGILVTPQVLFYGSVGAEHWEGTANYMTYGAGLEFMVADNFSVDAEYKRSIEFPIPWYVSNEINVSALYHF